MIGGTARAVSHSLHRAGIRVAVLDRFGDEDLIGHRIHHTHPIRSREFLRVDWPRAVEGSGAYGWLYTGGWENSPRHLKQISNTLTLFGNSAETVTEVRNPQVVSSWLTSVGFPSAWNFDEHLPSTPGNWILKPRKSVGGQHVRRLSSSNGNGNFIWNRWRKRGGVIQREIFGQPLGISFLAKNVSGEQNAAPSTCILLGVCQSLTCYASLQSHEFGYCGSIGPLSLESNIRKDLERLGVELTNRFNLRGVFGVDAIRVGGEIWILEINPRFSASMELIERHANRSLMQLHMASFDSSWNHTEAANNIRQRTVPKSTDLLPEQPAKTVAQQLTGKAIQYVPKGDAWIVGEGFVESARQANRQCDWPLIADIPRTGTRLLPGQPAFTVFASVDDRTTQSTHQPRNGRDERNQEKAIEKRLLIAAQEWWRTLTTHSIREAFLDEQGLI